MVSSTFPFFYRPVAFQSFGGFLLCPPFTERSLKPLLWVKLCHPKVHTLKFYLLAPQNVTASGHRIFKKVTKLKCSHKCRSWSNRSGVIKKRKLGYRQAPRDDPVKTQEKMALYRPRREASEETNPTDTAISNFQLPELGENKFLLFKSPCLGCFSTAVCISELTQPLKD